MSFQDDVEARYKFCKEKANCLPPAEAEWYIAYAELAFLRSAMLKAKEDKEAMIRAAVSAAVEVACANAKGGTHEEPKDDE